MPPLLSIFKVVTLIFGTSAVATGAHALLAPSSFSCFFGLPLVPPPSTIASRTPSPRSFPATQQTHPQAYVSLLGVRQLATGFSIFAFAAQGKWEECATILAIIGVVVAGTDGLFLARGGQTAKGVWHAGPGFAIAALAMAVLRSG